jgi:FKBP-type peptidyl-prolyl cis-trans isomerase (trigger factor)
MAPKESAADTRRYFLQTAFLQKAVEASKIKVSKKEAEKWAQKMMRAMDQQLANNGEDFEKYYEGTGTTEKELMDEFIKEAEKQLKSRMVLYEIAREQNLLATSEEYDAEVHRLAQMSLMPEDRLRELCEAEEAELIKRILLSQRVKNILEH